MSDTPAPTSDELVDNTSESEPLPDIFETYENQRLPDENSNFHDFIEISAPAPAKDADYPVPNLNSLTRTLQEHRLLVVAGELVDKRSVARRAAWEFAQARIDIDDIDAGAAEARHTADAQSLLQALDNTERPTVFVFPDTEPHKFGGNLQRLFRNTRQKHWVILTTERPRDSWVLQASTNQCWMEPERVSLYTPGALEKYLNKQLQLENLESILKQHWHSGNPVEARDLATRLETPESIDAFIAEYKHNTTLNPANTPNLEKLLDLSRSPPEAVYHWFNNQLDDREKTVAIALALLVGLDEDVAFDVIEHLMEGVWRRRDTSFRFIDYGDLKNLRDQIFFEQNGSGSARIVLKGADSRHHILRAAWPTHRRQIVAALAALVSLAQASISKSDTTIAAFRQKQVKKQIQKLTGESLGDTARLSLEAVEPLLLNLAADGRINAHYILADALAQLRAAGETTKIFAMLSRWRSPEFHRYIGEVSSAAKTTRIEQTIGSAIIVSLGKLALYDAPNEINSNIVELLKAYCKSDQTPVIRVLSYHAIPSLIPVHWLQMKSLLPDFFDRVSNDKFQAQLLVTGAGFGLGQGLLVGRQELHHLIRDWLAKGLESTTTTLDESTIGEREKEMAASLHALSLSRTDGTKSAVTDYGEKEASKLETLGEHTYISPVEAGDLISSVLNQERHPFVRRAAIASLEHLLAFEFEIAAPTLEKSLTKLSPEERNSIAQSVVNFHCRQREKQSGGDTVVRIGKYDFPIWYDQDAPTTKILSQVFEWASNAKDERVSAFAGDIVMTIRREVERLEEQEVNTLVEQREKERQEHEEKENNAMVRGIGHSIILSTVQRSVIVPFVCRGKPHLREPVAGQLAVAINLNATEQAELIQRYRTAGKTSLANTLENAIWYDRNKGKFIWTAVILCAYLFLKK